jgi:hypothetical protein
MTDHVIDDLEAYALGALDRESAERIAVHLAGCTSCRDEASGLAGVVGTLPDTVPLRDVRPILRERVLAAARGNVGRVQPRASRAWPLGSVRPMRLVLAGLTAAAIVLLAVDVEEYGRVATMSAERDRYAAVVESLREGGRVWYMVGKDNFAGSGGTLFDPRAQGKQPFVLFHDLPRVPEGKFLAIWLVSPDSTWARAATFRPNADDVQAIQINSEVVGFDRCAVTVEDSPWGPRRGPVVMESRIAPSPGG